VAPVPISLRGLNRATLARQGLLNPITGDPADAVRRVGSLQAQHPEWPPVALAARAGSARSADLASALGRRSAVRSSLMRITIHVVVAEDLWPMFTVMRPMRLDQWRLIMKADPETSALGRRISAAHRTAIAALRERPRSSLELDRLIDAEIRSADARGGVPAQQSVVRYAWRHFAASVPLVHVPHDGEGYGRSLYALAEDWLGEPMPELPIEEARAHVARRYLAAFGPATVDDLAAYVGRGKGGIGAWKAALAAIAHETIELRDDDGRAVMDLADAPRPPDETPAPPRLLARWDSLLLSHASKARGRVLDEPARAAAFTKNADVKPTFLVDGRVAGTWELHRRDGGASVTLRPLRPLRAVDRDPLVAEAERVLALLAADAARSVRIGS
jgi:Winged helix DNA-binding domain